MRNFFQRQGKFRPLFRGDVRGKDEEHQIPEDLWVKCPKCGELLYSRELDRNAQVCPKCGHHFRLNARERIALLADADSYEEWDTGVQPQNPLKFIDPSGPYDEKLAKTQKKTGETDSLITGKATIKGRPIVLIVAEFSFMGASMGSVFGEKMTRAVERAIEERLPVLTVNASGGARMHEGLFSLMQMAKTIAAFHRLGENRLPHFSLLVDPCYGGVPASYATVADVMLAEPGALIGFAGQRVIEQVTRQKLPEGFQTAEFLLEHGMIDQIVDRNLHRDMLGTLVDHYLGCPEGATALDPREYRSMREQQQADETEQSVTADTGEAS
ncbi:MAG TPA: acetyl-CoA carboxylase, carboxyltransferase subunit beta [Thermomicrobiales bacterium]|nr:acetyl-CoA carboxylase, carboxyltransferase subunit beta [Thermomicrobiales bacterium]